MRGLGFKVGDSGFLVLRFRVQGLGFRVYRHEHGGGRGKDNGGDGSVRSSGPGKTHEIPDEIPERRPGS